MKFIIITYYTNNITMTTSAFLNRIKREANDINMKDACKNNGITIKPKGDELFKWESIIKGPANTPYETGYFKIDINLPSDYPYKPPHMVFKTKIFHPNINPDSGSICIDILKDNWSPALTLDKVLLSLISLLEAPNPDDPLNTEAANLYKGKRQAYDDKVKQFINKYGYKIDGDKNDKNDDKNDDDDSDVEEVD